LGAGPAAVFATSSADPTVATYKVQSDGSLVQAPRSPYKLKTDSGNLENIFTDPKGRNVYVPDCAGRIFSFKVNAGNAALTRPGKAQQPRLECVIGPGLGRRPDAVAYGQARSGPQDIRAFQRNPSTGRLKLGVTSSSGLHDIRAGAADPSGRFLLLAGGDELGE